MALMSFLHAGWLGDLFDSTPTPPISVPIDLSKAGSVVETEVRIDDDSHNYIFSLHFFYINPKEDGKVDAKKVLKFAGFNAYDPFNGKQIGYGDYEQAKRNLGDLIDETYNCDGTVVPIQLTIYQLGENNSRTLVIDKSFFSKGYNGGSGKYSSREFAAIDLAKGRYLVKVQSINGFVELRDRKVELFINKFWMK